MQNYRATERDFRSIHADESAQAKRELLAAYWSKQPLHAAVRLEDLQWGDDTITSLYHASVLPAAEAEEKVRQGGWSYRPVIDVIEELGLLVAVEGDYTMIEGASNKLVIFDNSYGIVCPVGAVEDTAENRAAVIAAMESGDTFAVRHAIRKLNEPYRMDRQWVCDSITQYGRVPKGYSLESEADEFGLTAAHMMARKCKWTTERPEILRLSTVFGHSVEDELRLEGVIA